MKKRVVTRACSVLLVIVVLISAVGCSQVKDLALMKPYAAFMKEKYETVNNEIETVKTQLYTMSWTSFFDDGWMLETRNDLQSLSSTLGEIINFSEDKVPEKMAETHQKIVSLSTRSRVIVDEYIQGIDHRDLASLTEASIKLAALSDELYAFKNEVESLMNE